MSAAILSTDLHTVDEIAARAAAAAPALAALTPIQRARLLDAVADHLDAAAEELLPVAVSESHLSLTRLTGELARTTYQLRTFRDLLVRGYFLEATIEHANPNATLGPSPDLRRILRPIGPVAVFSASNFPFAFSVAGGDTASALAAGCPVVVKAHSGHPRLSALTAEVVSAALDEASAPMGSFAVIYGQNAGVHLLGHDAIAAGAFTGSTSGGRALFNVASARRLPIPFYGELGSVNPVFVTREAVSARGREIVAGFVASYTLGAGQFCTKPGIIFLPSGHGLNGALSDAVGKVAPSPLLNNRIASGYQDLAGGFDNTAGVRCLALGTETENGFTPSLYSTSADILMEYADVLLEERFGPSSIVVEYDDAASLVDLARLFEGTLTATIHAQSSMDAAAADLLAVVTERTGRVIWNQWPTGVTVSPAMTHGGPYPSSTSVLHTSVGTTAIRRFLRPVSYQGTPDELLPPELRDGNPLGVPRWVDGELVS